MNKLIELRRAKMLALSLLLIAAATFVVTLFLPPNFWVSGVKAIAEAAMVGALADWFAVVALFRRVPIPIISRHTAIIPRNKDRIGENLGQFVQEKFLDTQSLVALIRRHEPALLIGNWFSQPENARRVGQHLLQIMSGFLELTDDARIQRLLKRAVHRAIDKVDLSVTSALILESMTRNDRHQVLLDTLIAQLIALLQRDKSRKFIAQQIVRWLESEHPLKAKILPTEWLGEHSAELVSDAVNSLLDDISRDRAHQIRHAFDRATFALIDKLKNDPEMAARADAVKSYLKEDEAFNRYLSELWGDLREWLNADINSEDSRVKERIARAGQWFGESRILLQKGGLENITFTVAAYGKQNEIKDFDAVLLRNDLYMYANVKDMPIPIPLPEIPMDIHIARDYFYNVQVKGHIFYKSYSIVKHKNGMDVHIGKGTVLRITENAKKAELSFRARGTLSECIHDTEFIISVMENLEE